MADALRFDGGDVSARALDADEGAVSVYALPSRDFTADRLRMIVRMYGNAERGTLARTAADLALALMAERGI